MERQTVTYLLYKHGAGHLIVNYYHQIYVLFLL